MHWRSMRTGKSIAARSCSTFTKGVTTLNKIEQTATTIREVCRREELLAGLAADEDFFDHGVSSLAVIQMQIRIEEALGVIVPTSELMGQPTINAWIDL